MIDPKVQSVPRLLLFSELYRPWVGGSVRWVEKIGEHWPVPARVMCGLTPRGSAQHTDAGPTPVRRIRLRMADWGVDSPDAAMQYGGAVLRLASACMGPQRPDLVLCGRGVPEGLIARLAGRISRVPYAPLVHGEEVVACGTSRQLRWMLRAAYGAAACVICNSRHSEGLACGAGARPDRIIVSHPGVEVRASGALLSRRPGAPDGPVTLITVGRFDERKNHAAVLRAVARLRGEGLELRYIIAGDGPRRRHLMDLSHRLGLARCVTWIIGGSDEKIQSAYLEADIFVMPAVATGTDIEGFGIVYLEAALAALPSIAGAHGGCKEAVLHEQTGLIVDGDDDDGLARAIRTLATDAGKRRRLGLAARDRARREFDWPGLIHRLAGEVARVLGGQRSADEGR